MERNDDVARAWVQHHTLKSSNLSSDGKSLWSYGWYEIGRHVGGSVVLIRHSSETHSRSTARHMSTSRLALAVTAMTVLMTRGNNDRGILAEPDWKWVVLSRWFEKEVYRGEHKLFVRLNEKARFRGDSLLTKARNSRTRVEVTDLPISNLGSAAIGFLIKREQKNYIFEDGTSFLGPIEPGHGKLFRTVDLNDLVTAKTPPPSSLLAAPYLKDRTGWKTTLFHEFKLPCFRNAREQVI